MLRPPRSSLFPYTTLFRSSAGVAQRAVDVRIRASQPAELQVKLTLHVWRQKNPAQAGRMVRYEANDVNPDMSMVELLDVVNEELILKSQEPIAFEHDCREGICGSCGFMINGIAHGPGAPNPVCQLSMRHFKDGDELYIEPWRAKAFPIIKDLVVDRSAFDRIIEAGGYRSEEHTS